MHYFSNLFEKLLYIFRTGLLSTIRSISTLYARNRYLSGQFYWRLLERSGWNILTSLADSQHNQHDKYLLMSLQWRDSWWWTVDLSKKCRVLYQNKLEKKCISLIFIIRVHFSVRQAKKTTPKLEKNVSFPLHNDKCNLSGYNTELKWTLCLNIDTQFQTHCARTRGLPLRHRQCGHTDLQHWYLITICSPIQHIQQIFDAPCIHSRCELGVPKQQVIRHSRNSRNWASQHHTGCGNET
jgi:hypothetical protein